MTVHLARLVVLLLPRRRGGLRGDHLPLQHLEPRLRHHPGRPGDDLLPGQPARRQRLLRTQVRHGEDPRRRGAGNGGVGLRPWQRRAAELRPDHRGLVRLDARLLADRRHHRRRGLHDDEALHGRRGLHRRRALHLRQHLPSRALQQPRPDRGRSPRRATSTACSGGARRAARRAARGSRACPTSSTRPLTLPTSASPTAARTTAARRITSASRRSRGRAARVSASPACSGSCARPTSTAWSAPA